MILPKPSDAIHRSWLQKLLIEVLDNKNLANVLYFKGGTCATMLGYLDRFSVDLDFDLKMGVDMKIVRKELLEIFSVLGLKVKEESKKVVQYVLKYGDWQNQRNSMKLEAIGEEIEANDYEVAYLIDIDRYARCQTVETMFAHKLVALVDRFEKHGTIAGRDVYDMAYFFRQGYKYKKEIIEERRGVSAGEYLKYLRNFVEDRVTETVITQDLSFLLTAEKFRMARKMLKSEVLMFLREEIERIRKEGNLGDFRIKMRVVSSNPKPRNWRS